METCLGSRAKFSEESTINCLAETKQRSDFLEKQLQWTTVQHWVTVYNRGLQTTASWAIPSGPRNHFVQPQKHHVNNEKTYLWNICWFGRM